MATSLPSVAELKGAARAAWPEQRLDRFRVHNGGWANLVLEADAGVIFRFPRRRAVAESLNFELRALDLLSRHLSAPIPAPVRVSVLRRPRGWPFMAYPKLLGKPLSTVWPLDSVGNRRLSRFIETLLRELSAVPSSALLRIGAQPGGRPSWAKRFRRLQQRFHRSGASQVPWELRRRLAAGFDSFYSDLRRARYHAVATHRDLGPDHILWSAESNPVLGN